MDMNVKSRANWPATILAASVLLGAIAPMPARAQSEATAFQIDAAHDGACAATNIVYPLVQKWNVPLSGDVSYPVIAGGRVFVTVYDTTVGEMKLYAFNEADGSIAWGPLAIGTEYSTANATYDRGTLFVDDSGVMQAFNAMTGAVEWSTVLPLQYAFEGPPTASGGTLYASGGGDGGTAYALDEANGKVLWYFNNTTTEPGITVGGGAVYLTPSGKEAYDLDPATGAVVWHDEPDYDGEGSFGAFYDGDFFIREPFTSSTADGAQLNGASGALVGSFNASTEPAFAKNLAFFLNNNVLSGNSIATQTEAWSITGSSTDPFVTAPIVAGGAVIEGTASGNLTAYAESTGKVVWTSSVGANLSAPQPFGIGQPLTGLAAAGGLVVVPAPGTLVAFGSASSNVSSDVAVSTSLLTQSGGDWDGTITIKNISSSRLLGPFEIVLSGLTGAQLVDTNGSYNGQPLLFAATDRLAAGASTTVHVEFTAASPTFTAVTYGGVL